MNNVGGKIKMKIPGMFEGIIKKGIFGLVVILSIASCNHGVSQMSGVVDIEHAMKVEKNTVLSELCDSIECIALETNDSSLLNNRAYLLYDNEKALFVRSDQYIYRFSSDGHFLNRIGRRGDAPGEYNRLHSVSIDSINERFLFYVGHNKIQVWGYDGVFQKEILLKTKKLISAVCLLNGTKILAENRLYSDKGLDTSLGIFDMEGNLIKETFMEKYNQSIDVGMYTMPVMYAKSGGTRYKGVYNHVLYIANEDTIIQQVKFYLGRYEASREYFEDMNKRETLLKEMVQLVDIQENVEELYILLIHDNALRGLIVDKSTGRIEYSGVISIPQNGGGIENDYIAGSCFWPSFISNSGVMYSLLSVENVSDKGLSDIKRYSRTSIQENAECNPFVIKAYPKAKSAN